MKSSLKKSPNISQQVYHTLGTYLRLDPKDLHPEDSLRDDLGLDSLQTIELVYEVEAAFDLQVADEDFSRLTTIGAVILYLEERLQSQGTPQPDSQATSVEATTHPTPLAKKPKIRRPSKKSQT